MRLLENLRTECPLWRFWKYSSCDTWLITQCFNLLRLILFLHEKVYEQNFHSFWGELQPNISERVKTGTYSGFWVTITFILRSNAVEKNKDQSGQRMALWCRSKIHTNRPNLVSHSYRYAWNKMTDYLFVSCFTSGTNTKLLCISSMLSTQPNFYPNWNLNSLLLIV